MEMEPVCLKGIASEMLATWAVRSLSPFLRGEGWGEGQTPDRCELLDLYPLTRMSSSMPSDLSPQAGRG
jgi:hypothetical protein